MWTQVLEGCVCQTPSCAQIELNMYFGMHFIQQMQQMLCLQIEFSPLCFIKPRQALHQHQHQHEHGSFFQENIEIDLEGKKKVDKRDLL